jgi:phospholipid/cholesterol/gamma-HCH transport system substrate-binding protein
LSTSSAVGRFAAIAAVAGTLAVVAYLLLGGGGPSYEVTAEFQNASQLVKGNQVEVAGLPAGSIEGISLGPHGEALVKMSINDHYAPLKQGTQAVVRSQSLSGIANRYVELNMPPADQAGTPIPDGGMMSQNDTVSEVDLDQFFNTFDRKTVKSFKKVLTGFAVSYDGVGPQANAGFHYANPLLSTSRRVFAELNSDQQALQNLIVDTASLSSALDSRAPQLAALIQNVNKMMGAIGRENVSLAHALDVLPAFMREFDTTGVNLRATLDDLDPLVNASKPVAKKLQPFTANLRGFAADAVPAIKDLDSIVRRPGANNDLVELTRLQVPLGQIAGGPVNRNGASRPGAFPAAADALSGRGLAQLAFFRPYVTSEGISGWFDDFSHSGITDANGGMGRIATTFNNYTLSTPTPTLDQLVTAILNGPVPAQQVYNELRTNQLQRCPDANERGTADGKPEHANAIDNSTPFHSDPSVGVPNGVIDCDPTQTPTGP